VRTFCKDYSEATIISVYMGVTGNAAIRNVLMRLQPHVRIVSHDYPFDGWQPTQHVSIPGHELYLYHPRASSGTIGDTVDTATADSEVQ
jgi:hypothetical protein